MNRDLTPNRTHKESTTNPYDSLAQPERAALIFPNEVKAIALDLDGTVLDTEFVNQKTMEQAAKELGYQNITPGFFRGLIGKNQSHGNKLLIDLLKPAAGLNAVLELRAHRDELKDAWKKEHGIPIKEGVAEIIATARELSLPLIIVTASFLDEAEQNLARANLLGEFKDIFALSRDKTIEAKPDPDLYNIALEFLGLSDSPGNLVAVEDSINGILSAHAAGAMPVIVPDLLEVTPDWGNLAIGTVSSLAVVARAIKNSFSAE